MRTESRIHVRVDSRWKRSAVGMRRRLNQGNVEKARWHSQQRVCRHNCSLNRLQDALWGGQLLGNVGVDTS